MIGSIIMAAIGIIALVLTIKTWPRNLKNTYSFKEVVEGRYIHKKDENGNYLSDDGEILYQVNLIYGEEVYFLCQIFTKSYIKKTFFKGFEIKEGYVIDRVRKVNKQNIYKVYLVKKIMTFKEFMDWYSRNTNEIGVTLDIVNLYDNYLNIEIEKNKRASMFKVNKALQDEN